MENNRWVVEVQADDDEYFIELPDDLLKQVGWKTDDTLLWEATDDGAYILKKKEEDKIFLVETITITKHLYAIKAKSAEHAMDSVVMCEAPEFGQQYIDENIISSRLLKNEAEYLTIFDECNKNNQYSDEFKTEQIHIVKYD